MQSELITKLAQDFKELERVLKEEEAHFSELELDEKQLLEQVELASFLNRVQIIATSLARFLQTLREVFSQEEVLTALRQVHPTGRGGRRLSTTEILPFYWAAKAIEYKLHNSETGVPFLWEITYGLCTKFAYLGSSMTASSSLISKMEFFTEVFELPEESDFWNEYTDLGLHLLKTEHITGLRYIADRAAFLAVTSEDTIRLNWQQTLISWWCQDVDSTPKENGAYYTLEALLMECPDPADPEVVVRLRQIATAQNVDTHIRESAHAKLEIGG